MTIHNTRSGTATLPVPRSSLSSPTISMVPVSGPRALEDDDFPFEILSDIAEAESWRKEINRPIYHIHKWWARRLGTVFRAMVIGAFAPTGANILDLFYRPVRINGAVIFDPFMGSGTTIGEATKLGARAIGKDINPVAHFLVKNALAQHDRASILSAYSSIERDVSKDVRHYYRTIMSDGSAADVLYYFWVKVIDCPACDKPVDLFSSRVFARHANPSRHSGAQSVCPDCGGLNQMHYRSRDVRCDTCYHDYDPQAGPVAGPRATCTRCFHSFPIAQTIRRTGQSPRHRLYAKLVLSPGGTKEYMPINADDLALYREAQSELMKLRNPYPVVEIQPGYNTNQALGYNYRYWHEMFNDRQLLCLSILASRISSITDTSLRELFTCLFSGTLEFYNMFASYKGEGTGAVRHMFAHHIIKPQRVPLEANLWGTPKSSGAFSTLFERRILRTLDYADSPFEIRPRSLSNARSNQKVHGLSEQLGCKIASSYPEFASGASVYLSCGDSSTTDIPDGTVDAVITDPPFFDNIHYSQLADFFFVWQQHILDKSSPGEIPTTRSVHEVQNADVGAFTQRLLSVWCEAHRVLKDHGVLSFTYHHSRPEGWHAMLKALRGARFAVSAAHPIKSEMSVAVPKRQAKAPIDVDMIIVCRKRTSTRPCPPENELWRAVSSVATDQVTRMRDQGRRLGHNDIRVIVMAQVLRQLSTAPANGRELPSLDGPMPKVDELVAELSALSSNGR